MERAMMGLIPAATEELHPQQLPTTLSKDCKKNSVESASRLDARLGPSVSGLIEAWRLRRKVPRVCTPILAGTAWKAAAQDALAMSNRTACPRRQGILNKHSQRALRGRRNTRRGGGTPYKLASICTGYLIHNLSTDVPNAEIERPECEIRPS
eukprot:1245671-Rhodomonas_salina.1